MWHNSLLGTFTPDSSKLEPAMRAAHRKSTSTYSLYWPDLTASKLELELIQTQTAQKPMLRAEVYAHAMRASQNRKKGSA